MASSRNNNLVPYVSPLRKWVIACFIFNAVIALVFGVLAWMAYKAFQTVVTEVQAADGLPLGISTDNWSSLFIGVAASAAFALILTIGFHAMAVLLMVLNFKSLGHPSRKFARAFVVASAWLTGVHILNITILFQSFIPTMSSWQNKYKLDFDTQLLYACVTFGYFSTVMYLVCGTLVFFWREHPELMMDNTQALEMQV